MIHVLRQRVKSNLLLVCLLGFVSCSNMSDTNRHALTSGALGAAGGAVGTILMGGCIGCSIALGGAIGAVSSYIYDYIEEDQEY